MYCGKSTMFKQLHFQYNHGFDDNDRNAAKEGISHYMMEAMVKLLDNTDIENLSSNGQESAKYICSVPLKSTVNDTIAKHIQILWNENFIKTTFETEVLC